MRSRNWPAAGIIALSVFIAIVNLSVATWADAPTPKPLFDLAVTDAAGQLAVNDNSDKDVTYAINNNGIDVTVVGGGKATFPGIKITPTKPWDATGFGHIQAKITNNGTKPLRISLSVANEGAWQDNRTSADSATIKPGQSGVVSTIFGYNWKKAGYKLQPDSIIRCLIFTGKTDVQESYRIESIEAAGPSGEKPYIDPNSIAVKPAGGVLFDQSVSINSVKQLVAKGGGKAALVGASIKIEFASADQSVTFKPVAGMWNLNDDLQVRVHLKNTGNAPATPSVQLLSQKGPSDTIAAGTIAPGGEADVIVPFAAAVPWKIPADPAQLVLEGKNTWIDPVPGTGTRYTSNTTNGVCILSGSTSSGAQSLEVTSITAEMPPPAQLPAWLGQRPPVEGDWTKTFEDNFDGSTIDLNKWNIYSEGEWHIGSGTHYSKDNVIVKDGHLILRQEHKFGHQNDNPAMVANGYATGYADTYGKWAQRYGYFEARMKLPTAPNMFLAFWMMPDRGLAAGPQYKRADTKNNGMEFDIMETLSIWGPWRHDFGMHWDGYMKYHKSNGFFTGYAQPDKEGFITVGMLWTPGLVVMYDNGKESARWESPRISSVQSYFILDLANGGWEADPMDDAQLPADFVIDYVRAWQRKDLASAVDGPRPNEGGPLPPTK